jgi:hypothetical protein
MKPYTWIKSGLQICMMVLLGAVAVPAFGQSGNGVSTESSAGVSDLVLGRAGAPIALLKCTSADGSSSCTADQVAELNRQIVESRKQYKPLSEVQDLDLGQHSWLKCSQMDGKACTDEQLSAVIAVASEGQAKRNGLHLVKPVEMATR